MSELRYDPVKQKWTVIAVERSRRPHDFRKDETVPLHHPSKQGCPFCPGNEDKTPKEIYHIPAEKKEKGKPYWQTRVVPNKYPALRVEGELKRTGHGMYDSVTGIGAHEIIIESPEHIINLSDYTQNILYNLFYTYRARMADLSKDVRFRYIMAFKNFGEAAGASLVHPHSQIIALPVTPDNAKVELNSAKEHYRRKERCLFCDILGQEKQDNTRIVYENQDFIAFCPYASALAFETHIMPKRHNHDYTKTTDQELSSLAEITKEIFSRLDNALEHPPLNMLIHTSPPIYRRPGQEGFWQSIEHDFHWHIEIVPRLTSIAGFEWGTGFSINPVMPEEAAKFLKDSGALNL